jgi:hypothetical protein
MPLAPRDSDSVRFRVKLDSDSLSSECQCGRGQCPSQVEHRAVKLAPSPGGPSGLTLIAAWPPPGRPGPSFQLGRGG